MSKLTLDEAIKHCLEVAERQEKLKESKYISDIEVQYCDKCAADHRQLAEWLMELRANRHYIQKICNELAFLYESPCQNAKADGFMREIGNCKDCSIAVTDSECWQRYFALKLGGADDV